MPPLIGQKHKSREIFEKSLRISRNLREIFEKSSKNSREIFEKSSRNPQEILEKSSRNFHDIKCRVSKKKYQKVRYQKVEYQKVQYRKVEDQKVEYRKVEIWKSRINIVSDATYISDVVLASQSDALIVAPHRDPSNPTYSSEALRPIYDG